MSTVSPAHIKELREKTGAGMMDCKNALDEAGGDMEAAIDWLRKKGLAKAAKKAGRTAAEGLVAVASGKDHTAAGMIELNSETDFVARNEEFQSIAAQVAAYALETGGDIEKLKAHHCSVFNKSVADAITGAIAKIGENMSLRRSVMLRVNKGTVATYVHGAVAPGLGKIGVLVALESEGRQDKLLELGRQIAMHVAAARPEALTPAEVDPGSLAREREVLKEQAIASGKPADIAEKMVEGRIRKYYEEVVLLEQIFVIDGKTRVKDAVKEAEKEAGAPIRVTGFARFTLGEGIEKESSDFAAEVAKAANG